jgi:hypothetical protein
LALTSEADLSASVTHHDQIDSSRFLASATRPGGAPDSAITAV